MVVHIWARFLPLTGVLPSCLPKEVVTYSQERIVDGWKAHSLIPVKRGFSSFDGSGLLDTALDGDIFLFVHQKSRAYGLRITSIAKY